MGATNSASSPFSWPGGIRSDGRGAISGFQMIILKENKLEETELRVPKRGSAKGGVQKEECEKGECRGVSAERQPKRI